MDTVVYVLSDDEGKDYSMTLWRFGVRKDEC